MENLMNYVAIKSTWKDSFSLSTIQVHQNYGFTSEVNADGLLGKIERKHLQIILAGFKVIFISLGAIWREFHCIGDIKTR